jgi:hypothetical protein
MAVSFSSSSGSSGSDNNNNNDNKACIKQAQRNLSVFRQHAIKRATLPLTTEEEGKEANNWKQINCRRNK